MAALLLLAFIGVPILEIAVFIEVGGRIGAGPTLAAVVVTAIAGTTLLRHQGLATLGRVRESLDRGRLPVAEVFDGLCLLVAGALLLTPGFVTDAVGLLLFVPAARSTLRAAVGRYLAASGRMRTWSVGPGRAAPGAGRDDDHTTGTVIEGEYHEVDTNEGKRPGGGV